MKKEFLLLSFLTLIALSLFIFMPIDISEDDNEEENVKVIDKKQNSFSQQEEMDKLVDLTFDIVRISPHGDAVMAGKTKPNIKFVILDGENEIASVISDPNGEWVWVSDLPLEKGIKKLSLKHFDNFGNEHLSKQNIVIFLEKDLEQNPIVIKYSNSKSNDLEVISNKAEVDGVAVDVVNYSSDGDITISGRSRQSIVIKVHHFTKLLGETKSDENGNWKFFITKEKLSPEDEIKVSAFINNQNLTLVIPTSKKNNIIETKNIENKTFVVQRGNSLWRIARQTLGGGIFYAEIYKNNIVKIKDPDLIFPGQVFNIPNLKNMY